MMQLAMAAERLLFLNLIKKPLTLARLLERCCESSLHALKAAASRNVLMRATHLLNFARLALRSLAHKRQ